MLIWQTYDGSKYNDMKTPSSYKLDYEGLDKDSYRNVTQGNLIRNMISNNWTKISMDFKNLTASEVQTIMNAISGETFKIKASNPFFTGNNTATKEMEVYCNKKSLTMNEIKNYDMSFNLVQTKKVSGQ